MASWASASPSATHGPEDLLADVLDLDRAGLVRQVGERRLHRDQPVEEVLLVVLEADVEDVGLAAGRHVARHLEGHRRLAGALGAADEQQLAGAQAAADRLVERREAERDRLVLGHVAGGDLVVEVDEDVERRARAPGCRCRCRGATSASARARRAVRIVGAHAVELAPRRLAVARRVAPDRPGIVAPGPLGSAHATAGTARPAASRAGQVGELVEEAGRRPGCPPSKLARSIHSFGACAVVVGRREAEQHDRQAEDRLEAGADRDRAALADVERRPAEGRLQRPGGGLRRRVVDRRQARPPAARADDLDA